MKQKISFPLAITFVIVCAALLIVVVLQYGLIPGIKLPTCCLDELSEQSSEQIAEDETSGWKTYRSEYYGFEIKYPEDWSVIESEVYNNYIVLINNNDSLQQIEILKSSGPPPETMDMQIIESKTVIVDNITTTRELMQGRSEDNKGNYYLRVFIPVKSIFYHADFNKDNFEEFSQIFDQILSTFKFID